MKKIIILLTCLLATCQLWAQESAKKELSFIYIAHDENTDTQALIQILKEQYENTIYYPDIRATIFYLANGDEPIIVNVNTPNDNRNEFNNLIISLQSQISHDIIAESDVANIIQLMNDNDIITDEGESVYEYVIWSYYINSTFWKLGNNESIIAKLYFTLEMEELIKSRYLTQYIYYSKSTDKIEYNLLKPLGNKNLCRGFDFILLPY